MENSVKFCSDVVFVSVLVIFRVVYQDDRELRWEAVLN